jgi:hypothetical protein
MNLSELNKKLESLALGKVLRIPGLDEGVYHAAHGLGSSLLRNFIEAPAKYKAVIEAEAEDKDYYRLGSLAHCLVLEPDTYSEKFKVQPVDIKVRRGQKWEDFKAENPDKTIITGAELEKSSAIASSTLRSHSKFFKNGEAEVSYFKRHESGILLKARIDYEIGDLAIDYKTTKNSEPKGFTKACFNLMYYIQAALYLEVTGMSDFAFIAAEKESPYLTTGPFILDETVLEFGKLKMQNALKSFIKCQESDKWPGYEQDPIVNIHLPGYLSEEYETLLNQNQLPPKAEY